MSTIAAPHIRIDSQGRPWVDETNTKVIEIVLDRLGYGWSPEEIHFQHFCGKPKANHPSF